MLGQTISRYRIVEEIGEGGMGVVYKAEDPQLNRHVAIKLLPPELGSDESARMRFVQEARAASALDHPNICTIHEIGATEDGQMYIVMALYEGMTLKEKLKGGPLGFHEAADITAQIASGLARAHEENITHRDIKPANIIITKRNEVKIVDFGLAKFSGQTRLTQVGTTVGTVSYMSPEQAEGGDVDQRSDIFSLGIVLYEMLTGVTPFQGEHDQAILYGITNVDPKPLLYVRPDIPDVFQRIVARALQKKPDDRYADAVVLLVDLNAEGLVVERRPRGRSRLSLKSRVIAGVVAVAVVAVVAFGIVKLVPERSPKLSIVLPIGAVGVVGFENLSDAEDTDNLSRMLSGLITTDLTETGGLQIVSTSKVLSAIKKAGGDASGGFDVSLANEAARHAGVSTMLTGQVMQRDERIILTAELVAVRSGHTIGSVQREASSIDELFDFASAIASEVRTTLGVAAEAQAATEIDLARTLTDSPEAYRQFAAGEVMFNQLRFDEAVDRYERAVAIDSTFAFANFRLGMTFSWLGLGSKEREAYARALEHKDRLSMRWQKILEASATFKDDAGPDAAYREMSSIVATGDPVAEAHNILGEIHTHDARYRDRAKLIEHFETALALDPTFKVVSYHLIEEWLAAGEVTPVRGLVDRLREEDPTDQVVAFGEAYLLLAERRFEEALVLCDSVGSDLRNVLHIRATALAGLGKWEEIYAMADEAAVTSKGTVLHRARLWRAAADVALGRFESGCDGFHHAAATGQDSLLNPVLAAYARLFETQSLICANRYDDAIESAMEGQTLLPFPQWSFLITRALLGKGDVDGAERMLSELETPTAEASSPYPRVFQVLASAEILLAKGDADSARVVLATLSDVHPLNRVIREETILQARALEAQGKPWAALELCRSFFEMPGNYGYLTGLWDIPMLPLVARLEEAVDDVENAKRHYREYLDHWGNADANIAEVAEAKRRLARLNASKP